MKWILSIFSVLIFCGLLFGNNPEAKIASASGGILIRKQLGYDWEKVRAGDHLPYESLIFVPSGGFIHLSTQELPGERIELTMDDPPMIFRVQSNLLRKVVISPLFVAKVKESRSSKDAARNESTTRWLDAWNRFRFQVGLAKPQYTVGKNQLDTPSLRLIYPRGNVDLISAKFPITIPLFWEGKDKKFKIKRHVEGESPKTIGETSSQSYQVTFTAPGRYQLLIQPSIGGDTVSVPVTISTALQFDKKIIPASAAAIEFPPKNLKLVATRYPAPIPFRFKGQTKAVLKLIQSGETKSPLQASQSTESTLWIESPGDYQWKAVINGETTVEGFVSATTIPKQTKQTARFSLGKLLKDPEVLYVD